MPAGTEKAKEYNRIRIRLRFIGIFFSIVYLLLFQFIASSHLKIFALSISQNFYLAFTIYLVSFCIIYYILNFPLHFYSSFTLEHKFSLSTQSVSDWIRDDIKKSIISLAFFLIFIHVLYFFIYEFKATWWIWIAFFWFFATVILAKVTPTLILPLFFKCTSVDEKIRNKVIELAKKCKIKILNVYKINFSKKTKKLNAAVIGLGKTRRVIMADNLINDFNDEEMVGVLAHEFAHHKMLHMWKLILFGALATFFSFYILYLTSSEVAVSLGGENVHDMKIFPVFMLILFITSFLAEPLQNGFSRRLERQADLFALKITENKNAFISLMKKLAEKNLADQNPSKLVKFLFYSHPPVSERIKMAENFKG